jgi:hypothetical protein
MLIPLTYQSERQVRERRGTRGCEKRVPETDFLGWGCLLQRELTRPETPDGGSCPQPPSPARSATANVVAYCGTREVVCSTISQRPPRFSYTLVVNAVKLTASPFLDFP